MVFNRKNLLALTAIGALTLAGCAAPTQQSEQTEQAQQQDQPSPEQHTPATDTGDDQDNQNGESSPVTEDQDDTATQGKVFTSKSITADKKDLKIDLYEIEDDGALATVKFDLTNEESSNDSFQVADFFSNGDATAPGKDGKEDSRWSRSLRGVTLTDTKNKKIHRVAYDTSGECLCDMDLSSRFVRQGDTIQLTASFAPIPDGQDTATVTIPNFGTFKNVPINR